MLFTNTLSSWYNFNNDLGVSSQAVSDDGANFYQWAIDSVSYNSASEVCEAYNTKVFSGRTNWRLAELDELQVLFDSNGPIERNWPVKSSYVSNTESSPGYHSNILLSDGSLGSIAENSSSQYVSCISEP